MIDEKELLELMVAERIQMLIKQMDSPKSNSKNSVSLLIEQAELILAHLPASDCDTLNRYIEHLIERMAGEEPCLYVGGFKDGIQVMKLIGEL